MPAFAYPARIEEAALGDFVVTFRDVPEAITGAPTRAEALDLAIDALSAAVEGYLLEDRDLPNASSAELNEVIVSVSPAVAARTALAITMDEKKVSGRALADTLGKDEKHVRRILAGKSTLDQAVLALRALGVRATLTTSPLES